MPAGADDSTTDWVVLARLLRPQGRKGELLAELLTDFPERFGTYPEVQLGQPAADDTHRALRPATIAAHWMPAGRNHGRIVLRFAGVDSIAAAEALAGLDVIVPPEARVPLEQNSEYISDLIGCEVFDRSTRVGTITGVDFPSTPDGSRRLSDAAPLLTVEDSSAQEILIPYVGEFLVSIDTAAKRIEMSLPDGLVEINRPVAAPASGSIRKENPPDAD